MPLMNDKISYPETWTADRPLRTDTNLFRSDGIAPTDDLEVALLAANGIDGSGLFDSVALTATTKNATVSTAAGNKAFKYQFGQENGMLNDNVVLIGKGNFLSFVNNSSADAGKLTFSYDDGTVMGISGGENVKLSYTIGIAPFHFYAPITDQFAGDRPIYVTQGYIELPYIENATTAESCKVGCVYGSGIKNGDLLTVAKTFNNRGHLTKAAAGDLVVARAGVVDTNMPPAGWIEWVQFDPYWMYRDRGFFQDSANAPSADGYGLLGVNQLFNSFNYPFDRGIKGLTDGAIMDLTSTLTRTYFLTAADAATLNAGQTINIDLPFFAWAGVGSQDTGTAAVVTGSSDAVFVAATVANGTAGTAVLTRGAGVATHAVNNKITISYNAKGQVHGIPTNLDKAGAIGGVRAIIYQSPFFLPV